MIDDMEISRRTWAAALKLGGVVSVLGVIAAVVATRVADISQAAIVLPIIVVAFVASWIQTGRVRRATVAEMVIVPARRVPVG